MLKNLSMLGCWQKVDKMRDTAGIKDKIRVGLIVPSPNTVMEPDLLRNLPPQVTLHTTRMLVEGRLTIEAEQLLLDEYMSKAAKEISTLRPDVVIFGCTSAEALRGSKGAESLSQELSRATGAPTVTVMDAVAEELRRLNVKRVAVLTPYSPEVNETIQASLENMGYDVVHIDGLNTSDVFGFAEVTPEEIVEYAREQMEGVEADCLFISCANLRAVEVLDTLTDVVGIPVVTSIQAVIEEVKRVLKIPSQNAANVAGRKE